MRSVLRCTKATAARVEAMENTLTTPSGTFLRKMSFAVCGCCLQYSQRYTRLFVRGMEVPSGCVVTWLILSSALLHLELSFFFFAKRLILPIITTPTQREHATGSWPVSWLGASLVQWVQLSRKNRVSPRVNIAKYF